MVQIIQSRLETKHIPAEGGKGIIFLDITWEFLNFVSCKLKNLTFLPPAICKILKQL